MSALLAAARALDDYMDECENWPGTDQELVGLRLLVDKMRAALPPDTEPATYPPCKGMNCGCTDDVSHSAECQAEHAAMSEGNNHGVKSTVAARIIAAYDSARPTTVMAGSLSPDGESWQHKCEETERALLYWKVKASQTEVAHQQGRAAGLEEAAKYFEQPDMTLSDWTKKRVAAAIRALN